MAEGERNVKIVINLLLNDLLGVLNKDGVTIIDRWVAKILFFLWFPICGGEAGLVVTPLYGYFCNLFPLIPVIGLFSPLFFLLCLSQISLHTIIPS